MANVLIIGDRWGITPSHLYSRGDTSPTQWFEYQFIRDGHRVWNKSWGGNQNHYQLVQARVWLEGTRGTDSYPDLVVWFHSELMRDFYPDLVKKIAEIGLDSALDLVGEYVYEEVTKIHLDHPEVRWCIMGGHSALRPRVKHLLAWADYSIDNLRNWITGRDDFPESQCMEWLEPHKGNLREFPGVTDQDWDRELALREFIVKNTEDRTVFYNGTHPSQSSMQRLYQHLREQQQLGLAQTARSADR